MGTLIGFGITWGIFGLLGLELSPIVWLVILTIQLFVFEVLEK